jgi:hypothetical protein
MKGHRIHHSVDHAQIFFEGNFEPSERKAHQRLKNTSAKWLKKVGKKLSKKLFTFETKDIKFSL